MFLDLKHSLLVGCISHAFVTASAAITQEPLQIRPEYTTDAAYDELHRLAYAFERDDAELARWNLDDPPLANATGNLVFETVASLMQHWPNTRYRNGHTIVAGTIPPGTLLYHGMKVNSTSDIPTIPTTPEWTTADPEHSIIFCSGATSSPSSRSSTCWQLTLLTTRPLRVLYFDGTSAAKIVFGTMDTQDLLAWGEVRPSLEWVYNEKERIRALCAWKEREGLQLDGFVRMEPDFEVMLCDFTSGVEVSSFLNLANPRIPGRSQDVPKGYHDMMLRAFELIHAGSWHNHFPGETRITLDLTRMVSFYDTELVPSLVGVRAGLGENANSNTSNSPNQEGKQSHRKPLERWEHRVGGISPEDIERVKARLANLLRDDPNPDCGVAHAREPSGIDWSTLIRVIIKRYSARLELLRYLLGLDDNGFDHDPLDRVMKVQTQLRVMLTPYILASVSPKPYPPHSNSSDNSDQTPYSKTSSSSTTSINSNTNVWATSVFRECAKGYTAHLEKLIHAHSAPYNPNTNPPPNAEPLLLRAVQETIREICRVTTDMWARGVRAGVDPHLGPDGERIQYFPGARQQRSASSAQISDDTGAYMENENGDLGLGELLTTWRESVSGLMEWLDWSVWVRCRPECGPEEICFLPTWPFGFPGSPPPWDGPSDEWERPEPKCVRRVEPYGL